MKNFKKFISMLLVLVMTVALAACGGSEPAGEEAGTSDVKAACVLGIGGLGDQGYNDLIYAGMERAKAELGIEFDYAEPKQVTDFEQILRDMSDAGEYEVIICVGFEQLDALTNVCADYPEQSYAYIDGFVDAPNVVNYSCREQEGSFLIGALAALMKADAAAYGVEDNATIGFVGAMENDTILRFAAGYDAGAKYINPDMNVDIQYVAGDNPFGDTTTAKEIALSQFNKGADIIYHAAGGSGLGVFTAAKEADFVAIGCNSNQNIMDPDHIVASMLKRVDTAAFEIVKAASEGTLKLGEEVVLGLDQGGIGYTLEGSNIQISEDIVNKLSELEQKVISGEVVVPVNFK